MSRLFPMYTSEQHSSSYEGCMHAWCVRCVGMLLMQAASKILRSQTIEEIRCGKSFCRLYFFRWSLGNRKKCRVRKWACARKIHLKVHPQKLAGADTPRIHIQP